MSRDPDSGKVFFAILGILIAGMLFFIPQSRLNSLQKEHETLEDEKIELESKLEESENKYYKLIESIGSYEDDFSTVYYYFEKENDVSFDEAKTSFNRIDKFYDSLFVIK